MNNYEKLNSEFFDKCCKDSKNSWQACCYLDEYMQEVYYHSVFKYLNKNLKTILDVGCGQADLLKFLNRFSKSIEYTGIDVSEEMISRCLLNFPNDKFLNSSFLDFKVKNNFDVILGIGVFNLKVSNDKKEQLDYLKQNIEKMYQSCNKSCTITLLSKNGNDLLEDELFYYDPWEILEYCFKKLTSSVILDHSSIPIDFILTLYKD